MKTKPDILLIGGGGHCHSVIDVIEQENKYNIAGIIDKKELLNNNILNYKVIGSDNNLKDLHKLYKYAFITIGHIYSNSTRIKLYNTLKDIGYILPTIISPNSYISKHSNIQEGTVIMHHALVNANTTIGKNCIINTKALIEHDVKIEDNCHISTGSILNGGVTIKENTFIGSNSVIKEYTEVSGFIKAGVLFKWVFL